MAFEKKEKRKNRRFFFTLKQSISTTLYKTGNSTKPITATLLSLSEGGASFSLDRKHLPSICKGDHFILEPGKDTEPVISLKGAEVEIQHIQNYHIYINICCGCKFTKIDEVNRKKIQTWIKHRLKKDNRKIH